jgi:short-chain fatty acids transporter
VAGLIAREIAQRIRIDFGWLVGGAYSGWMIFSSGFSSSIALSLATPGSNLNIVEKVTGKVLPLSATLLTPLNLLPAVLLLIALPVLFCAIKPADSDVQIADLNPTDDPEKDQEPKGPVTLAVGLHASQAATAMGVAYGEQVADMIQPFWALPVVAVAGISIRRVMGFTVMSFLLGTVLFGAALLILV